jgi:hypothetical protein
MAKKKKIPIRYTNRDYSSIREALVEHARRYYPDTFQDFSEAGFGSLMLDTVAYVGDILSFYLDYQVNESFLNSATEPANILRLARQMGYKAPLAPSSRGIAAFYVVVPASTTGLGPDGTKLPTLMKNTQITTGAGISFLLVEDIYFGAPENQIVVARVDENTGAPTHYAIRSYGQVISGQLKATEVTVGAYEPFFRAVITEDHIAEIISVTDDEGHEYVEVDYLSQDVIYKEVKNTGNNQDSVKAILKLAAAPRRFVVERIQGNTILQFGMGSETEMNTNSFKDPSEVVMNLHGRNYTTDTAMDPAVLNTTDKLGIVPANTVLRVAYRSNTDAATAVASRRLTTVADPIVRFDQGIVSMAEKADILTSLEVTNEKPITGGDFDISLREIKQRTVDHFATQNRAVTKADYLAMVYRMPPTFGSVKRCNILQDPDSLKRNLNLYVVSESPDGELVETNSSIKSNLKTWLNRVKMLNDTIDILDAKIVNLGINFSIVVDPDKDPVDIIMLATDTLQEVYSEQMNIGEPFYITDVWQRLSKLNGVLDVAEVEVIKKTGTLYSSISLDIDQNKSADGRYIIAPENVIFEIKFPGRDVKGTIR